MDFVSNIIAQDVANVQINPDVTCEVHSKINLIFLILTVRIIRHRKDPKKKQQLHYYY